ncbi:hypothetical protein BH23VER1_BH23VER1_08500 [soil metagenome]
MKKLTLLPLACGLGIAGLAQLAIGQDAPADKINFEKQLYPILEAKCVECHKAPYVDERGRTKKPKSGFRMDGAWGYPKGGDYQEDEGKKVIVPGKPDESTLYIFPTLPEDDDYHMPPKEDDLTEEEKAILKKWIEEGADFGGWVGNEEGKEE